MFESDSSRLDPIPLGGSQSLLSRQVEGLELGRSDTSDTVLLFLTQPGLLGVTEHAAGQEVYDETNDDEDKGDRVEVVNGVTKNLDADGSAPEVARQERNVKEGGRAHAQDDGSQRVEDEQNQRVADKVATDVAIPVGALEAVAVKDGTDDTVDDDAKDAQKGEHLVHGTLADKPLLKDVGDSVQGRSQKPKQVALEQINARPAVAALDMVAGQQETHATAGDQNADDLEDLVADLEQAERDDDNTDDGPEVEQLGREQVRVSVGQNGEIVAKHVEETQDKVLPAVAQDDASQLGGAELEERDGQVDDGEQSVVEDGL